MNIWMIVLLLGAVAMSFGPLMMLQPSGRQRRQEHLRNRARQLGLHVHMLRLPPMATDSEAPSAISAYCLPSTRLDRVSRSGRAVPWTLRRAAYQHELHFLQNWSWEGGVASGAEQQVLREWLPLLPASVVAVSLSARGWCFYWEEREGDVVLDQLNDALHALGAAIPVSPLAEDLG